MTTLKNIGLKHSYTGKGEKILSEFLLPALEVSIKYKRITSFFTVDSLLAISQGIQSLYEQGGEMQIVIGVHSVPAELIDAATKRGVLKSQIKDLRKELKAELTNITDALKKKQLTTLAWMIEDGLLSVRAAIVEDGIFHPKTLIIEDADGNKVAAIGSSNETKNGLGGNYEQLLVINSWEMIDAVRDQERFFNSLWTNKSEDVEIIEINEEIRATIADAFGDEYKNSKQKNSENISLANDVINIAANMPANFFVSGHIPALYQHQEHAVIEALSRWPIRVLLSDEVGLGKTFEAASVATFLLKYCEVHRVLILTPKSVLQQWQDELAEKFKINAWIYESINKEYRDAFGNIRLANNVNPIDSNAPNLILMSSQYARGGANRKSIFELKGAVFPDLLIVDEAHSVRIRKDISGNRKKTRMYTMLENVMPKIPHVIFATATPMQKDAEEYHAMLRLLGLPEYWQNTKAYLTSLELITEKEIPTLDEANRAGRLLQETVQVMKPSLSRLINEECNALVGLLELAETCDAVDLANYVQNEWKNLQGAFIKLHPANLLTVRNTRKSLEEIGYRFPKRILNDVPLMNSIQMQLFYKKIDDYITNYFYEVEKVINLNESLNTGFVRTNYQQRLASSLYSCRESLNRRLLKVKTIKDTLGSLGLTCVAFYENFIGLDEFDDIDEDEGVYIDEDIFDKLTARAEEINFDNLMRAIELELTSLSPLIEEVDKLIADIGDMKIFEAVNIALKHLEVGDQVLLFSRYTDTVDALINEFINSGGADKFVFGIYDGNRSIMLDNNKQSKVSKKEITENLFSGKLRLMICSDAASEGLNLQAARVLINADVPWTPSRLEQRIGRIARLGQTAETVEIYDIWYPNTIEWRMYRRIQKRLDAANIAIGEYPEVVSDGIRNIVLEDWEQEDDSYTELQNYRNSVQVRALKKLMSKKSPDITTSAHVRKKLIELCDTYQKPTDTKHGNSMKCYEINGEMTWLTSQEGQPESISLTSKIWNDYDFDLCDFNYLKDSKGNPSAFVTKNDMTRWVKHEVVPDLLLGEVVATEKIKREFPVMLPDPQALSMHFAVDCEPPSMPVFWPPISDEGYFLIF